MAVLTTPPAMSTLGEIVRMVRADTDGEIKDQLLKDWINAELGSISTKREWNFFYRLGSVTLPAADAAGLAVLTLPAHLKKLIRIRTNNSNFTNDASGMLWVEFEQGRHYDLSYSATTGLWTATFSNLGNSFTIDMAVEYYMEPTRLVAEDDDTAVPLRFVNVVVLAVSRRAKRKLMDIQESVLDERQYKEELQSMIDDDAREHDLPKQMQPSRNQSRDEYASYYDDERLGEPLYYRYI
jgi:hypothetical protein